MNVQKLFNVEQRGTTAWGTWPTSRYTRRGRCKCSKCGGALDRRMGSGGYCAACEREYQKLYKRRARAKAAKTIRPPQCAVSSDTPRWLL